jgi:hypothetical protein
MHGADIALLQRNISAVSGWSLLDLFAVEEITPAIDQQQDKKLISKVEISNLFCIPRITIHYYYYYNTRSIPLSIFRSKHQIIIPLSYTCASISGGHTSNTALIHDDHNGS